MNLKYELTKEQKVISTFVIDPTPVSRIRALRDFGDVKKGDLGGFVQSEKNLRQDGTCWIYDNAVVLQDACVYDDSKIKDNALVYGKANIARTSIVQHNTKICGNSSVYDSTISDFVILSHDSRIINSIINKRARIADRIRITNSTISSDERLGTNLHITNAIISNKFDYFVVDNIGSEEGSLSVYNTDTGIRVTRGCFRGTLDEFKKAVEATHGSNKFGVQYKKIIEYIEMRFNVH